MAYLNTKDRYGSLSIALHWLMLLLIAAVYAAVEFHDEYPKDNPMHKLLINWHFQLGLTVLVLVVVRLVLKAMAPAPLIQPRPALVERVGAWSVHLALYLFMVGMPLAGFIARTLDGDVTYFFGLPLPILLAPNPDLAETVFDLHGLVGNAGYFLIGFHALAALFHHYWKRDNTLLRMLPQRK